MPHLIWTPPALADVQRVFRFLSSKNPESARRAVNAIRRSVRSLAHQPHAGRPVENMGPTFRDWVIEFGKSGYVARYRIDGDTVVILAVRHQREAGF